MTKRTLLAATVVTVSLAAAAIPGHTAPNMGFPMGGPYANGFDDFVVVTPPPRLCRPAKGVGSSGETSTARDGSIIGPDYICEGDPSGAGRPSINRVPNQ